MDKSLFSIWTQKLKDKRFKAEVSLNIIFFDNSTFSIYTIFNI